MSFLYPRTVTVQRLTQTQPVGAVGYQSSQPQSYQTVGTYPASIQLRKESGIVPARLPGDAGRVTYWNVFVKAANGAIWDRDVLVDDLGVRYQVTAAYWNSLGYACLCERLEA